MSLKEDFIEFMLESRALMFGEFTTKSGRITNYFVNTGSYKTGEQVKKLGEYYADCIYENIIAGNIKKDICCLFGPAYKGIPLVITTSIALYQKYGINVNYSFNRKEEKDHGEGGNIVGYKPVEGDKILIIEDVITAGTAIRETIPLINSLGKISIEGIIVSVDRMEKGKGEESATKEIENEFGIKTFSIVNVKDIQKQLSK